jgi:hypothetical protein
LGLGDHCGVFGRRGGAGRGGRLLSAARRRRHLEYTGDDFEGDMKKMAADPETQRWWKETDPCQIPLPDAAAKKKTWSDMEEVYFLR